MKRSTKLSTVGMLALLVAAGCTTTAKNVKPTAARAAAQAQGSNIISGKVAETMDGGGYTYVLLEKEGKKTWVAIPSTKVTVGQELKVLSGAEMNNFPSKALNRTFDTIIFSGGVYDEAAVKKAAAEKANLSDKAILEGKVVETMNAGTYTYLRLENKEGKSAWSAVPQVKVAVGDEVEVIPGTDMGQFTSPSLKRSFENIHFSSGLKKGGEAAAAKPAEPAKAEATPALPPGHPSMDAAAAKPAADAPAGLTGKVVETMTSGSYTYILVEKDGKKTWAAVPATKVNVGQQVTLLSGNEMSNFTSKGLNRTFDKILFSNGVVQ